MAELGALSLRIEETGGEQVLRQVKALDTQAKQTGVSAETAAQALRGLGVAAKAVGGAVHVAEAEVARASDIVRQLGSDAKVTAGEVEKLGGKMAKLTPPKPFHGPGLPGATTEGAALASAAAARQQSAAAFAAERAQALQGIAAIERRIQLLTKGAQLDATRAESVRRLIAVEGGLEAAIKRGNLTAEQRIILNNALARSQAGIAAGTTQLVGALQRGSVASTTAVAATARQTAGLTIFGQSVTTATGRLSAFSTRGIGAANAVAFGLSQLATTGTISFRSLATSMAGFLGFFGAGGAIASLTVSTGLLISDFFSRTQKGIEETRKKATEELAKFDADVENARRSRDPASAAVKLQDDLREQAEKEIAVAAILHRAEHARTEEEKARLKVLQDRLVALKQEIALDRQALTNPASVVGPKGIPFKPVTTTKPKTKEDIQKENAAEIAALGAIAQARKLSSDEIVRLATLERILTAELKFGQPTKEREAEIWDQITKARTAAERSLPKAVVQSLVSGRPQAAGTLAAPSGALAKFLSPEQIRADIEATDRRIASETARINFQQTQDALSTSLANALVVGIANGFAQGLGQGGIGEGFRQMAAQMAQGLGSVAIDYGLKSAAIAKAMAGISKWLIANPFLAIAGGIALVALGRAIGGRQTGSGGGSFGGGTFSSGGNAAPLSVSRLIVDPNAGRVTPRLAGIDTSALGAKAPHPLDGVALLGVDKPAGATYLAARVDSVRRRGG